MKLWKLILGVAASVVLGVLLLNLPFFLMGRQHPRVVNVTTTSEYSQQAHGIDSVRLTELMRAPDSLFRRAAAPTY